MLEFVDPFQDTFLYFCIYLLKVCFWIYKNYLYGSTYKFIWQFYFQWCFICTERKNANIANSFKWNTHWIFESI